MSKPTLHKLSDSSSHSLVTRTLDAVDRVHARAAARIHDVRNGLRSTIERGIDRAEKIATALIDGARQGVNHADHVSADAVNRAQGVVGQAIEKARLARSKPEHLAS